MKLHANDLSLSALLVVGASIVISIFFQYGFIYTFGTHSTWILRIDAGSIAFSYHDTAIWLKSCFFASPTHQSFRWTNFFFTHSPLDMSFEVMFPIWVLILPPLVQLLEASRQTFSKPQSPTERNLDIKNALNPVEPKEFNSMENNSSDFTDRQKDSHPS